MSVFDQRHQNVSYQYNAAGNINFAAVENCANFIEELEKLKAEIPKARDAEIINAEVSTDVQYQIQKAIDQAQKSEPNKGLILGYLSKAKDFVKDVVNASELVTGMIKAIELAENLF
ncbi:MAG: hypothetical protein AAGJ08_01060 [Cyanobacteria bacterium P01_H01_bin.35]